MWMTSPIGDISVQGYKRLLHSIHCVAAFPCFTVFIRLVYEV
jgi:hypothetical protein